MSVYTADIVKNSDFKWTQKEMSTEDIKTIPYVNLFAWENKTNEVIQNYLFNRQKKTMTIMQNIDAYNKDFYGIYNQMYAVGQKLATVKVPYKGVYPYSITSNYSQISSDPSNWLSTVESAAADLGKIKENFITNFKMFRSLWTGKTELPNEMKPFSGRSYHKQTIKMFDSAEPNQYETTFPLLNEDSNLIKTHLEFILKMQSFLVPNIKTINIIELPALWRFEIPGIMVIPFGFIGKFTATPKGPSKLTTVNLGGKQKGDVIIPSAWEIHIVFNSLTPPSVQMQRLIWSNKDIGSGGSRNVYEPGYNMEAHDANTAETATPAPAAGDTPSPQRSKYSAGGSFAGPGVGNI